MEESSPGRDEPHDGRERYMSVDVRDCLTSVVLARAAGSCVTGCRSNHPARCVHPEFLEKVRLTPGPRDELI